MGNTTAKVSRQYPRISAAVKNTFSPSSASSVSSAQKMRADALKQHQQHMCSDEDVFAASIRHLHVDSIKGKHDVLRERAINALKTRTNVEVNDGSKSNSIDGDDDDHTSTSTSTASDTDTGLPVTTGRGEIDKEQLLELYKLLIESETKGNKSFTSIDAVNKFGLSLADAENLLWYYRTPRITTTSVKFKVATWDGHAISVVQPKKVYMHPNDLQDDISRSKAFIKPTHELRTKESECY